MSFDLTPYRSILVISPHLDDGALSVGGLVEKAVKAGHDVTIATVLTADAPPEAELSPLAARLHALWDLGANPYALRRDEDVAAVGLLGARLVHGGLPDALYRRDLDGEPLYPDRDAIFGEPAVHDPVDGPLLDLLRRWVDAFSPDLVLGPLTVGRHVDHAVTARALRQLKVERALLMALYEGMPYATGYFPEGLPDSVEAALARTQWRIGKPEVVEVDLEAKLRAIGAYASQIADIFPNGLDVHSVVGTYMRSVGEGGGFGERIWFVAD